ncbi:MAG TPA: Ig-like domain-containing protein [Dongiaceae bacterium]|jgi:hypothetical protein|nr:Ig-like domain-containing protein [Dongiaceae bacterium]
MSDTITIEERVASGLDDVEQRATGSMYMNSSDLELVDDAGATQKVGIRFTGIDIPTGALITKAYLQFQTDEVGSATTSLLLRGEDADDAAAFASTSNNVSAGATTDAAAAWNPPAWTKAGEAGLAQRSPDLATIVQEIVARPGWRAGNDMAFIITGSGTRTAEAFESNAAAAPLLHIEYTLPTGSNEAPALDLDGSAGGTGYSATFTESQGGVAIASANALITDANNANMLRATVTLANAQASDQLVVNLAGLPAGIAVDPASTASNIILTGSATKADYQLALRQVSFNNVSETPDPTSRLINVTVSDGLANSTPAVTTIAIDRAPDAVGDNVATLPDTAVTTGNVLSNDDQGDGPAVITGFNSVTGNGGTVADNGNGTFTYTPAAGFIGADSFTYTIADSDGDTSTATVAVAVNAAGANHAPTDVALLAGQPINENVAGAVAGTLEVADPDPGDAHTFTISDPRFEVVNNQLKLKDGIRLDYERGSQINLDVTATDAGGLSVTRPFTLSVTDVAEVRFAAFGDYGQHAASAKVASLVASLNVDFITTLGDNIYNTGTIDQQIGQYYSAYIGNYHGAYGPGSATDRFFPSLGNHDYDSPAAGVNASAYLDYFTLPGNERYYDYEIGSVHFFVVNSDSNEPDGISSTSIQGKWLQAGLETSTSPYNIVYFHHPAYSSGASHGSSPWMQWPFEQWGATAVLSGHDHVYERILRDDNGDGTVLPYFVAGLGGASKYTFADPPVAGSAARYSDDWGTMLVQASDYSITFEFWSITGGATLIDSYTIDLPSSAGAPPLFSAGDDVVDFNRVLAGSYHFATQYNALAGADTVTLPLNGAAAIAAGYDPARPFHGGDGNDSVTGGNLSDPINGDAGDDSLVGGSGNDQLQGAGGNDTLTGEAGLDRLFGDAGVDSLKWEPGDTFDGGLDFDTINANLSTADKIDLRGLGFVNVERIQTGGGKDAVTISLAEVFADTLDHQFVADLGSSTPDTLNIDLAGGWNATTANKTLGLTGTAADISIAGMTAYTFAHSADTVTVFSNAEVVNAQVLP